MSESAQLSFRHSYNLALGHGNNGADGAILEIKIGAGNFTNITAAGGSFVAGGYTVSAISGRSGNPLAAQPGWTGTSGGFITSTANLPSGAAGQTIQLRWRCGTSAGGGVGWYIDGVSISDIVCCAGISALRITASAPGVIAFTTETNKFYALEYRDDLMTGAWATLSNNIVGTGSLVQILDPQGQQSRAASTVFDCYNKVSELACSGWAF